MWSPFKKKKKTRKFTEGWPNTRNALSAKMTIYVFKISKIVSPKIDLYRIEFKDYRANSVHLDEVAHYEPPHQDLRYLQSHLFSPMTLLFFTKLWENSDVPLSCTKLSDRLQTD